LIIAATYAYLSEFLANEEDTYSFVRSSRDREGG